MNHRNVMALIAIAGFAAGAAAQDSISSLGLGLPGDGPNAFDLNDQVSRYVVDLTPFTTRSGTEFGIAPIQKSPDVDGPSGFFGSLISAQSISRDLLTGVAFSGEFAVWSEAGAGVGFANSPASIIDVDLANTVQQATLFAAFSGDNSTINGSVINIDPANPGRLYVTRVIAANSQGFQGDVRAFSEGVGSVDAAGNAYFRADGAIGGNNLFRVRLTDRDPGSFNHITSLMIEDTGATDALITGFGDVLVPPQNIPASIFGGNGSFVTTAFNPAGVFLTQNGQSAYANNSSRGSLGMMPAAFSGFANPGAIALSINTRDPIRTSITENIRVYAMNAAGGATGSFRNYDPTNGSITDPCTGVTIRTDFAGSINHFSQTAFRGPNAQTAVQVLSNGNLVAATSLGLRQETRFDQDPDNYIVAFIETPSGSVTEIPVAWTADTYRDAGDPDPVFVGKSFGVSTGETGYLLPIDFAFAGVNGPSMSAPAIDAAGNVWFTSTYFIDTDGNGEFDPPTEFGRVGLFRAVLDSAMSCYELELVVSTGDVFTGENSATPYQIQFIELSDSDSISSGAFFSGNVSSAGSVGRDAGDFANAAPETNGGVILSAKIVYDVDGDGLFQDPTGASVNPLSVDEAYQVLLYIGAMSPVDDVVPCPCDYNSNGIQEIGDYFTFLTAFFAQLGGPGSADFDGDGTVTIGDYFAFLSCLPAIAASTACP